MISSIKCEICLESFSERASPRVCNRCGNSICEACLNGIHTKQGGYICPFCKNQAEGIWAKNITIMNMMDEEKGANSCTAHKRRAISFCSSAACTLPPAICDLAQCSKIHKERGTNNIPLSLILESPDMELNKQVMSKAIEVFYDNVEEEIIRQIRERKKKVLERINGENVQKSCFKSESQLVVNKMKKCEMDGITSEMLAAIKVDLLQDEEHEEVNLKTETEQVLMIEKKELSELLDSRIKNTEVNFLSTLEMVKQINLQNQGESKMIVEGEATITKKIVIYEEKEEVCRNPNDPVEKFLLQPKTTGEYKIVYEVVKKHFKPELIFSAGKNPDNSFKLTLAGKPNLFFRIELGDGKVIGSFFKRPYIKSFNTEMFVVDPDAFVYWLDASKIYKASKNSVSQYDVSPEYLLSIGNTYKWDGFWFLSNFKSINPDSSNSKIKSQQYTDLEIPIPNKNVRRFQVFALNFVD